MPVIKGGILIKAIAVDLDDVLNNFTETLHTTQFAYEDDYPFEQAVFDGFLAMLRSNSPDTGSLLSTEYSFFRFKIYEQCYKLASARPDGIEFIGWLRRNGWQIVICSGRDLRRVGDATHQWLKQHQIAYDYLFMAGNKIVFCNAWGIRHLVDAQEFSILHGGNYGVQVYYPVMARHKTLPANAGRGFITFEQVKQWMSS